MTEPTIVAFKFKSRPYLGYEIWWKHPEGYITIDSFTSFKTAVYVYRNGRKENA